MISWFDNDRRKLMVAFLFWIAGNSANPLMSEVIIRYFPDRAIASDLFFELFTPVIWTQYVTDPIMIIFCISFMIYIFKYRKQQFANIFLGVGLIYFARAGMMILTPLGRPLTHNLPYGIFQGFVQHGMFPSGHLALAYFMFLFTERKHRHMRISYSILILLETVTLLLSRGHYSIDIVGGMMIAYITFRLIEDNQTHFLLSEKVELRFWE